MSVKDMKRTNWPRILRKDYIARNFEIDGRQGQMSLSILRELTAPLTVHYGVGDVLIADVDYSWLQAAVKDEFVWLTAMYDSSGKLVDMYFDITNGNCFDDPENPCFADMYLDIAVLGDAIEILDRDELEEALEKGDISRQEYDRTEKTCRGLYDYLREHKEAVAAWCEAAYRELRGQLP